MKPKISIIIPTYNRENYLEETIESVFAQKYENYEVIVSDNASTDNTTQVIQKYLKNEKFRYYKNEINIGMVKNWHKALHEYSAGEWFLILSDDDYFIDNDYLVNAVKLMQENKEIHLIYANGYMKYEETGEIVPLELPFDKINDGKKIFLSRGTVKPQDFTLCNILFKKEEALKFHPFENEFNVGCDSELFLFLCLSGKIGIIFDKVSVYRVHSGSLGTQVMYSWKMFINIHEYFLKPYTYAKEMQFLSKKELEMFQYNMMVPYFRNKLLYVRQFMKYKENEYLQYIDMVDPGLLNKINESLLFRMKLLLIQFPLLYKNLQRIQKKIINLLRKER